MKVAAMPFMKAAAKHRTHLLFLACGMFIGRMMSTKLFTTNNGMTSNFLRSKATATGITCTPKLEEMKNQYEAKLAEQVKLHEAQIAELKKAKIEDEPNSPPGANAGGQSKSSGAITSYPLAFHNHTLQEAQIAKLKKANSPPVANAGVQSDAITYPLAFHPHTLKGHQYFLPNYAMHRPAVQEFLKGRYYEPQTHCIMESLLNRFPGSMVHAGTFFGDMVPHFSTVIDSVSTEKHRYGLYAFEPNTRNYLLAQKAVEANELSNVILVNAALGPSVVQQRITVVGARDEELGGASSVLSTGMQRVPGLTIDMFNITDLSVIALDTEGFESFVLSGAMRTLKDEATRPLVVALEDNTGTGVKFMNEHLPEYSPVKRISGLQYFALAKAHGEVKKLLLQGCNGEKL